MKYSSFDSMSNTNCGLRVMYVYRCDVCMHSYHTQQLQILQTTKEMMGGRGRGGAGRGGAGRGGEGQGGEGRGGEGQGGEGQGGEEREGRGREGQGRLWKGPSDDFPRGVAVTTTEADSTGGATRGQAFLSHGDRRTVQIRPRQRGGRTNRGRGGRGMQCLWKVGGDWRGRISCHGIQHVSRT